MCFKKFENDLYCVGGKHYSTTASFRGDVTQNKKTGGCVKLLKATGVTCKGNTSIIVSDRAIQAEVAGDFFNI